ncbi:DUF6074 family protein [Phyllobacterium sp. P5_D12]
MSHDHRSVVRFPMEDTAWLIRETAMLLTLRKEENRRRWLCKTTRNRLVDTLRSRGLSTEEILEEVARFEMAVIKRLQELEFARDAAGMSDTETDIIDFEATKYFWELCAS